MRGGLALAYALLACEVFLRAVKPVPLFPRNVVATSYGVRGNKPGAVYDHVSPDVHVHFRINSKGIRADSEISYAKPPGVRRIVALGDSFGMGYELELKDTFLAELERALARANIKAEVVNTSVSGFGNAEELVALRAEGFKYQPDLVLVCWHPTDVDDNERSGLFALRDGKLVQTAGEYLPGGRTRDRLERVPLYTWLEANSQLFGFGRETVAGYVKDALVPNSDAPAASKSTQGNAAPPQKHPTAAEKLTLALLKQIREESAAHGARTLVLDIPNRFTRTDFASGFPSTPVDPELRLVSPIADFETQRGKLLYNEHSHSHLTMLAARLVGDRLARTIVEEHLLDPRPAP